MKFTGILAAGIRKQFKQPASKLVAETWHQIVIDQIKARA
jgi:hypothetical protein